MHRQTRSTTQPWMILALALLLALGLAACGPRPSRPPVATATAEPTSTPLPTPTPPLPPTPIPVPPPPDAPRMDPAGEITLEAGQKSAVRASAPGADRYAWTLQGDGQISSTQGDAIIYTAPEAGGGIAVVSVTARNDQGDSPSTSLVINIAAVEAPIDLKFEFPKPGAVITATPITCSGSYTLPPGIQLGQVYAWTFLHDNFGNYYLQNPPINLKDEGRWQSTNVRPRPGVTQILAVQVTQEGHDTFRQMVENGKWEAFLELPEESDILATLPITVQLAEAGPPQPEAAQPGEENEQPAAETQTVEVQEETPSWPGYERECEDPDQYTVGQKISRPHASGTQVHGQFGAASDSPWPAQPGYVMYAGIDLPQADHLYLRISYSKNSPSSVPIQVYIDDESTPRASFNPVDQGDWDPSPFAWTDAMDLGRVDSGTHSIKFYTDGQEYGVADLDRFTLTQ